MAAEIDRDDPLALAEAAYARVEVHAASAAVLAQRALALARRHQVVEAQVLALHALSFARHELGDPRALTAIRAAIRIGERHGLARRTALARRRLALDLAGRGAIGQALQQLERARKDLDAHERARSEVFRIGVLWYAGRLDDALRGSDHALAILRRKGDTFWEAQLLRNRGGLLAERGDAAAAEPDLLRARDLFARIDARAAAFAVESQLIRIALTRGDLPLALSRLDAVGTTDLAPSTAAEHELLRSQALAAAQLWHEALQALEHAQAVWARAGRDDHEGRFEVIRLTLLAGDSPRARVLALRAKRSFAAQKRVVHAARAGSFALSAAIADGSIPRAALATGRRDAAVLSGAGWSEDAQRLQLAVARAAVQLGSIGVARREMATCLSLRSRGPIADRIELRHVEALILHAEGDDTGAQRAARAGLRLLEAHRAALGATDLRATASAIGAELANLGLQTALAGGGASGVFDWAETLRASALRLAAVTPPTSPSLRDATTELRRVSAEIAGAEPDAPAMRTLLTRQSRLETQVRRLSRHSPGVGQPARATPSRARISEALGERALIEFVEFGGRLTAVTMVHGRLARHDLGPLAAVSEQLQWLRFALTRLAHLPRDAPQRGSMTAGVVASALALDEQLLGPVASRIAERELVIVPTGSLHDLPWSVLPSLQCRALVVSPSAGAWWGLRAARRRPTVAKVALVSGPRLRHATAEIRAIASLYEAPTSLTGRQASAAEVLEALDGAAVAHLACHGRFRADGPLFSSLQLADGPLYAYDLQRMRRAPELMVLSACDLAVSDTHPGDELLGFAAALLDIGTRSIIASAVPVPDAMTKRLMLGLHRHLIAGDSPAQALAHAQANLPLAHRSLSGFVCLGAA